MNTSGRHDGMRCPVCQINLVMTERQNVEIDYCPQCRGVWLDRGELDKIIERSAEAAPAPQRQDHSQRRDDYRHGDDHRDSRHDDRYKHGKSEGSRRKSWLSDLFD